jgi:hypothetical protein
MLGVGSAAPASRRGTHLGQRRARARLVHVCCSAVRADATPRLVVSDAFRVGNDAMGIFRAALTVRIEQSTKDELLGLRLSA